MSVGQGGRSVVSFKGNKSKENIRVNGTVERGKQVHLEGIQMVEKRDRYAVLGVRSALRRVYCT